MSVSIRPAVLEDLDAITRLTARRRARLAEWSPQWWRPAEGADVVHRMWLQYLLTSEDAMVRVVEYAGEVVGCAASNRQPGQWFVDDIAIVSDVRWHDGGIVLLEAVTERPALTCVPAADDLFAAAARLLGLHTVSSYWIRSLVDPLPSARSATGVVVRAAAPDDLGDVEPGPQHTFGDSLDPAAPGALLLADDELGFLIGSPSSPAPPVYDPGGTVTVVDRIVGEVTALLEAAMVATTKRGDVMLAVVCGEADHELAAALLEHGFVRTVNVMAWPER